MKENTFWCWNTCCCPKSGKRNESSTSSLISWLPYSFLRQNHDPCQQPVVPRPHPLKHLCFQSLLLLQLVGFKVWRSETRSQIFFRYFVTTFHVPWPPDCSRNLQAERQLPMQSWAVPRFLTVSNLKSPLCVPFSSLPVKLPVKLPLNGMNFALSPFNCKWKYQA
jgi:hypothetical protein